MRLEEIIFFSFLKRIELWNNKFLQGIMYFDGRLKKLCHAHNTKHIDFPDRLKIEILTNNCYDAKMSKESGSIPLKLE